MNLWETLILFFSFQAIIFGSILFLKRKGNVVAHWIWGTFLFLFAYNIFFNVLYWSKINPGLLMQLRLTYILCMALYGPLFYMYIRTLVTEKRIKLGDAIHLIPLGLALGHCGRFLFRSFENKIEIIQKGQFLDTLLFGPYFEPFLVVVMGGYGIAALVYFKKEYNAESQDLLIWLKVIASTYIGFCLSWVIYYGLVYEKILLTEHDYIITFFMILFIATTTYVGIEHPHIFNGKPIQELMPFVKYEKTGLSEKRSLEWKKRMELYMSKEKPYLDGELRLDDLAEGLGFSRHHTSQVINEHYGMNFFEFINFYRIQDAAFLLTETDADSLQITEIAYQVGFNNRTSFYRAFKKEFGVTPSEYRKNIDHPSILFNTSNNRP